MFKPKYLDYNSTTPVFTRVMEAMIPYLNKEYGNPSSVSNSLGKNAKIALEKSREKLADFLGAKAENVIFTSGGTEACFSALVGAYRARPEKNHFIVSSVEHPSILETIEFLQAIVNLEVSYIGVNNNGELNLEELKKSIKKNTNLISIMFANNETGVIFPIEEIAKIAKANGILFHTDAVAAVGKLNINFSDLSVDLLSISGHKFGAPKGVGALFIKEDTPWEAVIKGGGQENGKRGGTEAVANIVAMSEAALITKEHLRNNYLSELTELRDYFEKNLTANISGLKINGEKTLRIANTSSIQISGVAAQDLIALLSEKGIIFSAGSACKTGSQKPSLVLKSMGLSLIQCLSTIRISLGPDTNKETLDIALEEIIAGVKELRKKAEQEIKEISKNV